MAKKPDNVAEALARGLIVDVMKGWGLFVCPLNNGDWMVGRASHIYSITISDDHYKDERVSVASTLIDAVRKWKKDNDI